jgi:hypothetical protein
MATSHAVVVLHGSLPKQPLGCTANGLNGLVALYDQRISGLQHGHAAAAQTQLYCDGT